MLKSNRWNPTLNNSSLKLVYKFTLLGSSVSSTESDINTWLTKGWIAINRQSVIWKLHLTDKIKRSFFLAAVVSILLYWCTTWMLTKRMKKKQYWKSHGGSIPQSSSCTATYHPSRNLSKLDEPDMWDTAGEVGTNSLVMYSCGPLHINEQRQDDQQETTYCSSVSIRDVAMKTYRKRWIIGKVGERGSGISLLMARHEDGDMYKQDLTLNDPQLLIYHRYNSPT